MSVCFSSFQKIFPDNAAPFCESGVGHPWFRTYRIIYQILNHLEHSHSFLSLSYWLGPTIMDATRKIWMRFKNACSGVPVVVLPTTWWLNHSFLGTNLWPAPLPSFTKSKWRFCSCTYACLCLNAIPGWWYSFALILATSLGISSGTKRTHVVSVFLAFKTLVLQNPNTIFNKLATLVMPRTKRK